MSDTPSNSHHFSVGSTFPSLKPNVLRLYGMFYCPYTQRIRLVLKAKNIEFEMVNINLKSKPKWFLEINPLAKVPTLQLNDQIMYESMITCDFLDELYPDPPLYPKDPWAKATDKCLIEVFSATVIKSFYKFFTLGPNEVEEVRSSTKAVQDALVFFEDELTRRNTDFMHGSQPGMLDYAVFPWFERFFVIQEAFPGVVILCPSKFPKLVAFVRSMMEHTVARSTVADLNHHLKFIRSVSSGEHDFNIGVKK